MKGRKQPTGDEAVVLGRLSNAELADWLGRLTEDARHAGVEVDNPMRREVRPRRGTDEVD